MHYSDIKAKAKHKDKEILTKDKMSTNETDQSKIENRLLEEMVTEKYKGIKRFYDDINDPSSVVPNREELKKSMNDLLVADEKAKYSELVYTSGKKTEKYIRIIDSLINIIELLLHIDQ